MPTNLMEPSPSPVLDPISMAVLDSLSANVALLDVEANIVAVNRSWSEFASRNGLTQPQSGIGMSYLAACGDWTRKPAADPAATVAATITRILEGFDAECSTVYDCHSPDERRWFIARVRPVAGVPGVRVIVVHENVTPLLETQETLRRTNSMIAGVWKRRSRPLSDVDLHRVAAACRTESDRLIVLTLIDVGLRVSELTRIVPTDFDWDAPALSVRRDDAASGASRVLPLTPRTRDVWRAYLSRRPEFSMSTRQIQRIVRAVGDAAGLAGLSPQKLRQTCAVRLVENGATEAILSYAMGYEPSEVVAPPDLPELARLFGARDS